VFDGVSAESLSWEDLEGGHTVDVLFVDSWSGEHEPALLNHLKHGSLVLQPATDAKLGAIGARFGLRGQEPVTSEVRDLPGWAMRIENEEHPLFSLFATGAYGDPFGAHFRKRATLEMNNKAKSLLVYDDSKPALALVDVDAGGHRPAAVAWWNLDLTATNWPDRSGFVLFFGEFVQYMGKRAFTNTTFSTEPGDPLRFDAGPAYSAADVTLLDEHDQSKKVIAESSRAPNRLMSAAPAEPGSYRWMAQGAILERTVVSFPESESDLRLLSPEELHRENGDVIPDAAHLSLADLRSGKPVWAWFLVAAAMLFMVEALSLRFFSKTREAAPTVSAAGTPTKREFAGVRS
jgi:hypothetical protein